MSTPDHQVKITSDGIHGTVVLDGVDLGNTVTEVCLHAGVDTLTELRLELLLGATATVFEGQAVVIVADETRDVLLTLGWTPPPWDAQANTPD